MAYVKPGPASRNGLVLFNSGGDCGKSASGRDAALGTTCSSTLIIFYSIVGPYSHRPAVSRCYQHDRHISECRNNRHNRNGRYRRKGERAGRRRRNVRRNQLLLHAAERHVAYEPGAHSLRRVVHRPRQSRFQPDIQSIANRDAIDLQPIFGVTPLHQLGSSRLN